MQGPVKRQVFLEKVEGNVGQFPQGSLFGDLEPNVVGGMEHEAGQLGLVDVFHQCP